MKKLGRWIRRYKFVLLAVMAVLTFAFYRLLPEPLFSSPYAYALFDREGRLLSARLAADEQWRFPPPDSLPAPLVQCILRFEDQRFFKHPGVDLLAVGRALHQNWQAQRIVSGASTLSMQVIRLSRSRVGQSFLDKGWEMLLALRLEMRYSKEEILRLYAGHAPYGGNVVGVEAAAWRYFQRPLHQLSWSEYALLAVLPNAPGLMHPGKSRTQLRQKRDRLLEKLVHDQLIDSATYALSLLEPVPEIVYELPRLADHALAYLIQNNDAHRFHSSLSEPLQQSVQQQIDRFLLPLQAAGIQNAAALVVDLPTNEVRAYVGNSRLPRTPSPFVDMVQAGRSSGSILKPFLYAKAFENGILHPQMLMRDLPVRIDGFSPQNFDGEYYGLVRADAALAQSLNVPAVLLLQAYGLGRFHRDLQQWKMRLIQKPAEHYGLSLILGGGEVCLWDLAQAYAQETRALLDVAPTSMHLLASELPLTTSPPLLHKGAWWMVSEALTQGDRPELHSHWKSFANSRRIAWKTGTSQGFRDAWAVGYDGRHLIAVWVGNAYGEGRTGLTGTMVAAPLMFGLFEQLPRGQTWSKPDGDLHEEMLCQVSGKRAGPYCPARPTEVLWGVQLEESCGQHQPILLDAAGNRVLRDCGTPPFTDSNYFAISPLEAYYLKRPLDGMWPSPAWSEGCVNHEEDQMAFVYPDKRTDLLIPINLLGEREQVLLKAAHNRSQAVVYWHLDDEYLGATQAPHEWRVPLSSGEHRLVIVDDRGASKSMVFKAVVDE